MGITNLGAVGISAGGVYNPETVYKKYKVVSANGGSYMYINSTPAAGVPVTDTSHWQQIAARGMTGPSAYDAAVAGGYEGTEDAFNAANAGIEAAKDAALDAAQTANEASEIALAISTADTWERVAYFVRLGKGPQVFPVGTKLRTTHATYGDIIWTVMAHDHDTNPLNPSGHTMRIGMDPVIYSRQIDAIEAFYYCENGLAAGTYHFDFPAGYDEPNGGDKTIEFTISEPIPAGGVIMFPWASSTQSTSTKLSTYTAVDGSVIESGLSVSEGNGGTNLGTADGLTENMNHVQRFRYGSNNAGESAARQWLNSAAAANAWWSPQTKFDTPPAYANAAGFLAGFDSDFLDAIIPVDVTVIRNTVYEEGGVTGGSYVLRDKMFLPSMTELGLGNNNSIAEGSTLAYYVGATAADRIKFDITNPATARIWFLRSPNPSNAYGVRYIKADGTWSSYNANYGHGVAPDCVIG